MLLIRVTPKLVEGFWTTVARGAARTQGVALPPIKHFKSGFSRMRAFCGDAEVTPIHPFKLEQRVSETDAIYEGLYVFDPGALGPQCGTVKLVLYSEKEPEKGDTRRGRSEGDPADLAGLRTVPRAEMNATGRTLESGPSTSLPHISVAPRLRHHRRAAASISVTSRSSSATRRLSASFSVFSSLTA